jgi:carboxyl-terminal processing protease
MTYTPKPIGKGLLIIFLLFFAFSYGRYTTLRSVEGIDIRGLPEAWNIIQRDYLRYEDYNQANVPVGLIKGLVASLGDDHSSFFDPEEAEQFTSGLNSELKGIGAELTKKDGFVTVVTPLPGTPAEKAGIRRGDVIIAIDGEFLKESWSLFDVVMRIRGPEGTEVVLQVLHDGDSSPVDIAITRANIHVKSVEFHKRVHGGEEFAYIQVSQFSSDVASELKDALQLAEKDGLDMLLLDLRFNGGGFLDGAVDVLSFFTDTGETAVVTRNRLVDSELPTKDLGYTWKGSLVVLVNDMSASASEIVAGALQDLGRATVVGTVTFGKGSVQEVKPVGSYGLMRLTIAEWLTPALRQIDKVGIEPDVQVEMPYDLYETDMDVQYSTGVSELFAQ